MELSLLSALVWRGLWLAGLIYFPKIGQERERDTEPARRQGMNITVTQGSPGARVWGSVGLRSQRPDGWGALQPLCLLGKDPSHSSAHLTGGGELEGSTTYSASNFFQSRFFSVWFFRFHLSVFIMQLVWDWWRWWQHLALKAAFLYRGSACFMETFCCQVWSW